MVKTRNRGNPAVKKGSGEKQIKRLDHYDFGPFRFWGPLNEKQRKSSESFTHRRAFGQEAGAWVINVGERRLFVEVIRR